jgi:hypothetical protein
MQSGRSRPEPRILRILLLPVLLAPAARADHPKDFRGALDGLRANRPEAVEKAFLKESSRPGTDRLLALYELGGLYHLAGDLRRSISCFNAADAVAHEYEGQALISASEAGRTAGALLTNDLVLKYEGLGFEKVLSRTLNSINYLMNGDAEGARVEVRKAEEYQRLERERHAKEVQKAGQRPPRGAESARMDNPLVRAQYGKMFDSVRNIRNSFENAFTYYLSSRIHLTRGEAGLNDAAVEIKRAFELAPEVPEVRAAYLEIARGQGGATLDQALAALQLPPESAPAPSLAVLPVADALAPPVPGAPLAPALGAPPAPAKGSVVVIFEVGLAPELDQVRFDLPANNKLYSLAFPIYPPVGPPQPALAVTGPGLAFSTSRILDTRALAVKSLQERMPGMLVRGLLGAAAKGEIQDRTEKEYGPVAGLFSKFVSAVVTTADRRSWLSLPAEIQVGQCSLPAGRQTLTLNGPGVADTVALDVAPGGTSFVLVRSLPGFRRIDVRSFLGEAPLGPGAEAASSPIPPATAGPGQSLEGAAAPGLGL